MPPLTQHYTLVVTHHRPHLGQTTPCQHTPRTDHTLSSHTTPCPHTPHPVSTYHRQTTPVLTHHTLSPHTMDRPHPVSTHHGSRPVLTPHTTRQAQQIMSQGQQMSQQPPTLCTTYACALLWRSPTRVAAHTQRERECTGSIRKRTLAIQMAQRHR